MCSCHRDGLGAHTDACRAASQRWNRKAHAEGRSWDQANPLRAAIRKNQYVIRQRQERNYEPRPT